MKKSMINKLIIFPLLLSALVLGACSNQKVKKTDTADASAIQGPQSGTIGADGGSSVNSTFNYLPGKGVNNDPNNTNDISIAGLSDADNLLSQRVIYFDYDKSEIRPEYMVLINTHAQLAAKFPDLQMRLEGHADERGSREYNVALSEARAQSVKRIMGIQGARSGQIKTIGYGEEVPIVTGHTQNSWQKNRRVEIKYDNY